MLQKPAYERSKAAASLFDSNDGEMVSDRVDSFVANRRGRSLENEHRYDFEICGQKVNNIFNELICIKPPEKISICLQSQVRSVHLIDT